MATYLAGIDVGTTGVRCMIFDTQGHAIAGEYCEYGASYPQPGWVEQDGANLVAKTMQACRMTVKKSKFTSIAPDRRFSRLDDTMWCWML